MGSGHCIPKLKEKKAGLGGDASDDRPNSNLQGIAAKVESIENTRNKVRKKALRKALLRRESE
jgi:hypothetical protein